MTDVRRGEPVGAKSVMTMLDHCITQIEENGFADGVDWDTEISRSVTVEELVGALVRSEYELYRIQGEVRPKPDLEKELPRSVRGDPDA